MNASKIIFNKLKNIKVNGVSILDKMVITETCEQRAGASVCLSRKDGGEDIRISLRRDQVGYNLYMDEYTIVRGSHEVVARTDAMHFAEHIFSLI